LTGYQQEIVYRRLLFWRARSVNMLAV